VKSYAARPYAWRTVLRGTEGSAKKYMVEDCLVLSIKQLFDRGLIERLVVIEAKSQ
jgi:hypothetical protein